MAQYIDKDALVAEIERLISNGRVKLQEFQESNDYESNVVWSEHIATCRKILNILDTLGVEEVDLEKHLKEDIEDVFFDLNGVAVKGATHYLTVEDVKDIAKHFFELGLSANNPITATDRGTAEEIIINLKRVEKDYRINLTKEKEWVRNQVKKGG